METNYTTTRQEAAKELGVSAQTISNWIDRGVLVKAKISDPKKTYVTTASVEALKASLTDLTGQSEAIEKLKAELSKERKELNDEMRSIRLRHQVIAPYYDAFIELATYFVEEFYGDKLDKRREGIVKGVLEGVSLSELANQYHLTDERARQIVNKEFNRIHNNIVSYDKVKKENKRLTEENGILREYMKAHQIKIENIKSVDKLLSTPLVECNLSVRALNCCKSADIETIGDLVRQTKAGLLAYRNFGKKTFSELDDLLEDLGLRFGMTLTEVKQKFV